MQSRKSKTKQHEEESSCENSLATRLIDLQKYMYNFALSLTRNCEDAEDLVMQVNEKVLSNPEKFKQDDNFKGWVTLIIRNDFINSYRRQVRRQECIYDCDPRQLPDESIPRSESADADLIYSQLRQKLREIPNYELLLGYMNGYTYDQLADIMELPIGTIKSRIFFARKQIKTFLKSLK